MKHAIIVCSGGLDSVTCAHYVKKVLNYNIVKILFFDYGQNPIFNERKCAKVCARDIGAEFIEIQIKELNKLSFSLLNNKNNSQKVLRKELKDSKKESEKWYVPFRNTIFLSYALALAEKINNDTKLNPDIFLGFKCEGKEHYPDTTKKYLQAMNNLSNVASNKKGIKIFAPFINKDKEDIIQISQRLGVNHTKTFSCYNTQKKHCGYCIACRLRQEGFYWANIIDPTDYLHKMKDSR